jgi:hypothetical protein
MKRDQFKAYGVKKDIPSTGLLAAQREIETLRIQLWNADATIQGYMRMVEGQASDLYASDTDTWTDTDTDLAAMTNATLLLTQVTPNDCGIRRGSGYSLRAPCR